MITDEEHYNQVLAVARSYRNDVERLENKLAIAQKALELACEKVKYFEDMQDRFGYEMSYDLQGIIKQYVEQAEKEMKGEE